MNDDHEQEPCPACNDTGWVVTVCGGSDKLCGRRRLHASHDFVKRCPCVPMNRNIQERQERYQAAAS